MPRARVVVSVEDPGAVIEANLYGHFAEHLGAGIYGGIWVGEDSSIPNIGGIRRDVVDALRRIRVPVLRWPGGGFADDYHWRDGIGPRKRRPRRVNIWWGNTVETNAFGTHEFLQFCRLIGAQPYICGNVGTGSPREMRDWVEYCNFAGDSTLAHGRGLNGSHEPFGVRYWGVGNESWGCGGNFAPEDYAAEYCRFSTYLRDFDTPLYLIACGPCGYDTDWTRRFFEKLGSYRQLHGFAAHHYCGTAGTATEYTADQWYELLWGCQQIERTICEQRAVMDEYDSERRIALIVDEWGTWHPPTPGRNPHHLWQQNTLRDALVAALTLDLFNRHADKISMANIAQLVNVLQSVILTEGDRMLTTPTYHVYDMYQAHQGARSLPAAFEADGIAFQASGSQRELPGLSGSASLRGSVVTLSVVNPCVCEPTEAEIDLCGHAVSEAAATVLNASDIHAHNTFDAPKAVTPRSVAVSLSGGALHHSFAPVSITVLRLALS